MSFKRNLLLVVLGGALAVFLLSTNLVVAADRTVLDADFTKETAEEAGVYETMTVDLQKAAADDVAASDEELPIERSEEELIAGAITEEYVQSQAEANIDHLYEFLHGERTTLRLEVHTDEVKDRIVDTIEEDVDDLDLREIDVPEGAEIEEMAESEEQFYHHREEFREERKQEIQEETERELEDHELERELDRQMDEYRDELYEERDRRLEEELDEDRAALEEPTRALMTAHIDALTRTDDEYEYDDYVADVEAAKDELGDAIVEVFEAELDEGMPDQIDFSEDMDRQDEEALETVQDLVGVVGLLTIALPILAIAVVGLIAWAAPASAAALTVGIVSTLVGALGLGAGLFAVDVVEPMVTDPGIPNVVADFAVGAIAGLSQALTLQSGVLLVVGVGSIGAGVAIRRGLLLDGAGEADVAEGAVTGEEDVQGGLTGGSNEPDAAEKHVSDEESSRDPETESTREEIEAESDD